MAALCAGSKQVDPKLREEPGARTAETSLSNILVQASGRKVKTGLRMV